MKVIASKYEIIKEFETLGDTQTYLAKNLNSDKQVIIKELIIGKVKNWKSVELFDRETKILKTLNHKAIPKYIDAFHIEVNDEVSFYLVQEYINGKNLQERINDKERFSTDTIYKITASVLDVLVYLEVLNPPVVHRDIKPSNIIMKDDSEVYLIDFGAIQNVTNINNVGTTVVGTTGFMAPEQLMGKASTKSDLYSLGVTIITLLSHQNPMDLPIKAMKLQYEDYINSKINDSFKIFIDKLIEPDSDKRFQNVSDAITSLKQVESDKLAKQSKLTTWNEFEEIKKRNYSNGLTIFSIVFLLLVAVVMGYLFSIAPNRKDITRPIASNPYNTKVFNDNNDNISLYNDSLEICIKSNLIKYRKQSVDELKFFECRNLKLNSSDIEKISNFKSLTSLDLSNNKIENITSISKLKNLKSLYIAKNKITDLSPLKNLTHLKRLTIYNNKISDLSPLKNLKSLKYLTIFSNKIEDISALSDLTSLEKLHLGFNKINSIKPLSKLINLKELDFGYNKVSSLNGIENLTNLTSLKFGNNNITDISKLKNLKNITWLNISHNNITDISVLKNLKRINYLIISNNNITDISAISELEDLTTLWAGQNNIDKIPNLSKLKRLKILSLWSNNITNLSPLKNVNISEELNVTRNSISDFSAVEHIKNVKK